jgi:hypothetical protein
MIIALYIATAYLTAAAGITALARLAGLPWPLAVLVGITWGPVGAWCVGEAAWKRMKAKWIAWRKR